MCEDENWFVSIIPFPSVSFQISATDFEIFCDCKHELLRKFGLLNKISFNSDSLSLYCKRVSSRNSGSDDVGLFAYTSIGLNASYSYAKST